MRIRWTDEAIADLEEILVYLHQEVSPRTGELVYRRIVGAIESLPPFPERIRASTRIPGTRELVVDKLPYLVFVSINDDTLNVLNIVHTRRRFPRP